VVCTIHQPSSDIVECFQDLLLLASGRLCFCGPWGDALPFLADAGFPYAAPRPDSAGTLVLLLLGLSCFLDCRSRWYSWHC
jgi:hypothetical protein